MCACAHELICLHSRAACVFVNDESWEVRTSNTNNEAELQHDPHVL